MSDADDLRSEMVRKYGDGIVTDIEASVAGSVDWSCRDTMDGRGWCRVHDASWPSFTRTGCTAWRAVATTVATAD